MSLAEQNALGLEVLDMLGHGVCLVGEDDTIHSWNVRLEHLGVPSGEALGRRLGEVLDPLLKDRHCAEKFSLALQHARRGDSLAEPFETGINFPTRAAQVFRICAAPIAGGTGRVVLIFENITEARRAREEFERILDSTPDGIFVIDAERRVRFFNRACAYITGRNAEEVLHDGCECSEVIHCHTEDGESLAHNLCPAKSVFRGENLHDREEMLLLNADGQERWVETTYSPLVTDDGRVEYVVGILRDVHDRKILEERLNQTEKLASLGQLVAGIAHEIKNPLAIILSSLDVLENPRRPVVQRQEAAQFMREEIKRLDERLRAFLAFARPRALHPQPLVPSGLIKKRAAALQSLFPNVVINIEIAKPEPIIMGDEEQLHQVLTNLVMNAGEIMEGRGQITLRLRQQGDMALIEVEDQGPGVPEEIASRIFDPFFTTRADGTGLGLSICYQLILAHNGTISVSKGKDGRGAKFIIRLPMATR